MSKEQNEKNFITSSNSGGGLEPPTSSWLAVTITSVCMVTTAMVRHSNTVINASSFSTFHALKRATPLNLLLSTIAATTSRISKTTLTVTIL